MPVFAVPESVCQRDQATNFGVSLILIQLAEVLVFGICPTATKRREEEIVEAVTAVFTHTCGFLSYDMIRRKGARSGRIWDVMEWNQLAFEEAYGKIVAQFDLGQIYGRNYNTRIDCRRIHDFLICPAVGKDPAFKINA